MSLISPSKRRREEGSDNIENSASSSRQQEATVTTDAVFEESPTKKGKSAQRRTSEEISPIACFGAGCYWGTEHYIMNKFGKTNGLCISAGKVGFMGPKTAKINPSYREVCSGSTGHVEVYDCEYSGAEETYRKLVKYFFSFHDPTTANCQGNDRGSQYASVIYCSDTRQFEIATEVKNELQVLIDRKLLKCFKESRVQTDIRMRTVFYPAHAEHQQYLVRIVFFLCTSHADDIIIT